MVVFMEEKKIQQKEKEYEEDDMNININIKYYTNV